MITITITILKKKIKQNINFFYLFQKPSKEEWKRIAADFGDKYQFWNCLGALDGKHVKIQRPEHSGSLYFNYKGHFSIVLMVLANANKEFIMIDVGANGRVSECSVLYEILGSI